MTKFPLRFYHVVAYGLLSFPLSFAAIPLFIHLPSFYFATTTLSGSMLGILLLLSRGADALIEPLLGKWVDKYSPLPLIMLAMVFLAMGMIGLFHPPQLPMIRGDNIMNRSILWGSWFVVSLMITYFGYSLGTIAHQSLGARLGAFADENYRQRLVGSANTPTHRYSMIVRLINSREIFALLGITVAAVLPEILGGIVEGLRLMAISFPLLILVIIGVFYPLMRGVFKQSIPLYEKTVRPNQNTLGSWRGSMRLVWQDKPFRILVLIFLSNGLASAITSTLFIFFVSDILNSLEKNGIFLLIYFLSSALSLPFWAKLSQRIGKVKAWRFSMVMTMLAFSATVFLSSGDILAFAIICLITGLALGADLSIPATMVAIYGHAKGVSGLYFEVWGMAVKLSLALAAGLVLPLVSILGYVPKEMIITQYKDADLTQAINQTTQSEPNTLPLLLSYTLIPLVFKMLAFYGLSRSRAILETR